MGDRALIIMHSHDRKRYSPVVYLHWDGYRAEEIIQKTKSVMDGRPDDVDYAVARLVGVASSMIGGNTGLGVWNLESPEAQDEAVWRSMSHGDKGVFLVDAKTFEIRNFK